MSDSIRRPRRTAAQWQSIVDLQIQSGLSGSAFCKAEGLTYQSFMNWRKRLGNELDVPQAVPESQFVELTAVDERPATQASRWQIELDLAPGVQLRIAR